MIGEVSSAVLANMGAMDTHPVGNDRPKTDQPKTPEQTLDNPERPGMFAEVAAQMRDYDQSARIKTDALQQSQQASRKLDIQI